MGIATATAAGDFCSPRLQHRKHDDRNRSAAQRQIEQFLRQMRREWRPEPESNRRARICSPLRNHSAIGPWGSCRLPTVGMRGISEPASAWQCACAPSVTSVWTSPRSRLCPSPWPSRNSSIRSPPPEAKCASDASTNGNRVARSMAAPRR